MSETALPQVSAGRGAVNVRGASLRAVYIIWYRDVLRYWRDRWRVGASLAQPLLYLVIFGTGLSSSLRGAGTFGNGGSSLSYQQFMFPGIMSMAVLFTAIFGAMSIVWDREFGFLKEVLVAPINRSAVAIGKTLGSTTQAMIQGLIILVLAPFVGVKLTPLLVLEVIPLTFALAFSLSALGVAVGSGIRSIQGFQMVMNFLMMPMFFLSGALFPLSRLPGWMTVLTRLDPAAYGVDPLRRVVLSGSGVPDFIVNGLAITLFGIRLNIAVEELILLGFGFILLAAAIRNFQVRD
ncbi:MAG TPA: ABC transporter [Chloroflexi bacterium]|jgi:ABC-2 type transport system permease protein|nr:ABC transporter [Chloroflexota bacterium]